MGSTDVLDTLREERDKHRNTAVALMEADDYDPDSEAIKAAEERAAKLDKQIERLAAQLEQQSAADQLDAKLAKAAKAQEREAQLAAAPTAGGYAQTRESWGEQFIRSDAFKDYRWRGTSGVLEFDAGNLQHRGLPMGLANLVAQGFDLGHTTVDVQPPPAPTPLLDAITQVQVTTNAIEFVHWEVADGGAAIVAEKGTKPSIEFTPVVASDTLDTIAVWTQLTRQLVEDAPAVRSLIDQELVRDVLREEEAQAAAAIEAASLPTASGADLLSAIRVGIGTIQAAGYMPNAVLLNPADWASLDVTVMGGTLNGPVRSQSFWGLTPIPSIDQAEGTAIVGDFATAVQQFYRSAVGLYVTDSHADTFVRNVFTILAERRSLTAVVRPQALVEVSGPATTPPGGGSGDATGSTGTGTAGTGGA